MRYKLTSDWLFNGDEAILKGNKDLKVCVPSSIYNDLLKYNLIEEPFFRANEAKMLSYMKYDYSYSKTFEIKECDIEKEISLYFLGLDTVCEIYVNDMLVGKTFNMHRRYRFFINKFIHTGTNILKVVIKSCLDFIEQEKKKVTHELMNMQYAVNGYATIRKAHCMFGWDWGPQMPDGGIWRDCFLEISDKAYIENVKVVQNTCASESILSIKVSSHIINKANLDLKVTLKRNDFNISQIISLENEVNISLKVKNPELWYPNEYGEQPLYELNVDIIENDEVIDSNSLMLGLRDIKIKREKDQWGESFLVVVNDIPVFIKGSDYIIEDNILPHTNLERTKYLLNCAKSSHQNCIRIWGGALYQSDEFYSLCDSLGILIWQDLMFACGYYDMENIDFVREIKEEIKDNISRIHNHACLMLICGNNENETAALNWNIPSLEYTKKWYLYQYEELIPSILKEVAEDIFYWPSSPSSGGGFFDPNSDNYGDMHYWGVWHGEEPIEAYRNYFPRMMSEFGMQSFPSMKTIKAFTNIEDRNIYSYVMERHQKNRSANQKIINYIGQMFKYPKHLVNIAYVSQLIQAEAVKYCVEHLRRNYGRCMGSIYWQLNDCWPVASWSSIDYYGRFKALQYYAKKFYAPILISIEEQNSMSLTYTEDAGEQKASIVLTNETPKDIKGKVRWSLLTFDGIVLKEEELDVSCKKFSTVQITSLKFNLTIEEQMETYLRVKFTDIDNNVYENSCSFVKVKYFNLREPKIECSLKRDKDFYKIILKSNTYTKYVSLDFDNLDVEFSDNFFDLYPNEEKVITFKTDKLIRKKDILIKNITDTF